jgi:catechol 2,3-dioxygenase-like lactoylglutathione lyase family enzyme
MSGIAFRGYDHVGIRVTDRARSLDFYTKLGFALDAEFSDDEVAEIVAADGTRINLIFNGVPRANNVLLDEPVKWPGYTHGAFVVESLEAVIEWAAREGIRITEGPVDWDRRLTCFLRDPDGNVLEFNELKRDVS